MSKVRLSLDKLNADGTVALATTIITAMTGNANFTTPNPSLATITTEKTTTAAKIAAVNTLKASLATAVADRDAHVATLGGLLTQLGAYAENVTGGDKVKLESGGLGVRADAAPITLTQVLNLVLTAGDFDGTLDVSYDPTRGATGYEIWTSVDPITGTSWAFNKTASKSSDTVPGLTSGTKLWVRVRATGANNAFGPWSDPATKTVP